MVYTTPTEAHILFKKLYKSLKNDENAIILGFISSLEKLKDYKEKEILAHIKEIRDELERFSF